MKKKAVFDLLAILLLGAFLVIFFFPVLFQGKTFVTSGVILSDLINQNYPFKDLLSQFLKNGKFPFWVSNLGDGWPLLAEGQVGAFYPFNLLFFYFLSPLLAFNLSLVFHYFLAGLFTYLLARFFLHLSPVSAFLAGLTFSLSGFMICHLVHLNMIQTACWLPLQLWLLETILKKPRFWQVLPLSLVFTFQFLAGHPEIFYFASLFLAGYVGFRLFWGSQKRAAIRILLVLGLGASLTVLLCAPQILETWQLVKVSNRGRGYSYEAAIGIPFPLRHLLTLVVPWLFDFTKEGFISPEKTLMPLTVFLGPKPYLWETYLYVGLIPLFLGLGALLVGLRQDERVRLLAAWLVLALLLALGGSTPVFRIFWGLVPGMKLFKYPTRFLLFSQFSLALLAGIGLECFLSWLKKTKRPASWSLIISLCLVGLTFVDLFLVQRRINPVDEAKAWFSPPQTAQFLKENLGDFRFNTVGTANIYFETVKDLQIQKGLRELLQPDFHLLFNISSTTEQSAILLEGHIQLAKEAPETRLKFNEGGWLEVSDNLVRVLSLKSVKYFLSALLLENDNLVLAQEVSLPKPIDYQVPQIRGEEVEVAKVPTQTVYIYENTQVLPRVRLVYQVREMAGKSEKEILETLVADDFDWQNKVVLEEKPIFELAEASEGEARLVADEDEYLKIEVESQGPGLLVVHDNFYPAWRAWVDGKEEKIYPANLSFRAVPISSGIHTVEFKYQPWSLLR